MSEGHSRETTPKDGGQQVVEISEATLLARVASIICEETCGLTSQCKSREAAKALFDKGYLRTPEASPALQTAIYRLCLIEDSPNLKEGEKALLREWISELRSDTHPASTSLSVEPVAWTTQAQIDKFKDNPGCNAVMWGEPLPYHPDIPLYSLLKAQSPSGDWEASGTPK